MARNDRIVSEPQVIGKRRRWTIDDLDTYRRIRTELDRWSDLRACLGHLSAGQAIRGFVRAVGEFVSTRAAILRKGGR
ncbi:hypothetical protein IU500_03715 [Nocardia terpenica]|uniref:hypothetical protein n=1 Tax=Nocardia terpenica TaxID=455432 RepID=UPI0018958513|nr:hypothetical protein [Nocardia terpenica]MBF6059311.1 hypothetical protein [Nocardia terpenica]MBF6103150.1 hypothetical protein [Nocardia terpenica]MBF6110661.1 hypothetical protein [Nocardia terpenica]MBF6116792.1 hypothetical protein [Nocardia terpenica]